MKKNLQKFFKSKASSIDESKYQATFVISDESVDRQGEIIKQDGWDFTNFKKNPVILFGHDSYDLPIGKAVDIYTEGDKTYAVIEFAAEIYDKAMTVFNMVKNGILNTVSVGFINLEYDNNELTKNELLEVSIVPIPANPNAIVLAAQDGLISRKDAQFMAKAMEKELEGLRNIKDADKVEDMEQLQQFITDALQQGLQPINDKLAELDAVLNGEGDDKPGLAQAVADIKTDIAKLQPADDGNGDGGGDDDGKGGDGDGADGKPGDKPGGTDGGDDAGDDEVDPDDLTEEQANQVNEAVAAALAEDGDGDGGNTGDES
jgi:HK97 family phage prohead protease